MGSMPWNRPLSYVHFAHTYSLSMCKKHSRHCKADGAIMLAGPWGEPAKGVPARLMHFKSDVGEQKRKQKIFSFVRLRLFYCPLPENGNKKAGPPPDQR